MSQSLLSAPVSVEEMRRADGAQCFLGMVCFTHTVSSQSVCRPQAGKINEVEYMKPKTSPGRH